MAYDFAGLKIRLNNVAQDIDSQRQRFAQAQVAIVACNATLGAMPTTYATVIADVDAAATANPADAACLNAKAEKDWLVANFQALKVDVQAAVDALAAI